MSQMKKKGKGGYKNNKKANTPLRPKGTFTLVNIRLPTKMDEATAKIFLRNIAIENFPSLYDQPVKTGIFGLANTGEKVPVNSVGRLSFGVPRYGGCMIIKKDANNDIVVCVPERSPKEVLELVRALKKVIES